MILARMSAGGALGPASVGYHPSGAYHEVAIRRSNSSVVPVAQPATMARDSDARMRRRAQDIEDSLTAAAEGRPRLGITFEASGGCQRSCTNASIHFGGRRSRRWARIGYTCHSSWRFVTFVVVFGLRLLSPGQAQTSHSLYVIYDVASAVPSSM
jgi:hypothetical protein